MKKLFCLMLPHTRKNIVLFEISQVWSSCPSDKSCNNTKMNMGHGGTILQRNRITRRETFPSATLFKINLIFSWSGIEPSSLQ